MSWETTSKQDVPVGQIAKANGLGNFDIINRARSEKWPPRPMPAGSSPAITPKPKPRKSRPSSRRDAQAVIDRLWAAVVRRLALLDAQLAASDDLSPQDAERVDRSMRIMMQNFEKVRSLDASNKRVRKSAQKSGKSTAPAVGAAALDAERRALAQRIEHLHAQWLARRNPGAIEPGGDAASDAPDQPRLADGGPPRAAPTTP